MTTENVNLASLNADCLGAVRSIVGRIAHDFNNMLIPLVAYPEMIAGKLDPAGEAASCVGAMEEAATAMKYVCERLLLFSGRASEPPSLIDVGPVVAEAVDTFRLEGIQADITVETEIEACSAVMASAGAIEAVVWELCRNSVEAMKTGGVLRVKAGDVIEREDRRSTCGIAVKAGTYVAIGVSDTGPGVPSAILPVAIQPFVTGKEGKARRGAGLGLSLAYAVARDHRGHLDMESRQGKGTTVVLEIPVKTGGGSVS